MKQNKFMRFMTSRALILTLQVVASGVLLYFVYLTKLLPVKYFAILAAVLAVLVLLFWIIIQTGKKKIVEGKTSKRTIISKVLSLIVSIVLVIGIAVAVYAVAFFIFKTKNAQIVAYLDRQADKNDAANEAEGA